MVSPKVSIIIPVHNTQQYLEQCLDSVVNQTLQDIEIICVDDGSTDNSFGILQSYADKDRRIRVFHHETAKSALGARKTGVLEATGEYIMFLDADDYYSFDACELVYNEIVKQGVDILHFSMDIVNCSNIPQQKINEILRYVKPFYGRLNCEDVFQGCFTNNKYAHTPVNKIYKSDLCKKAYAKTEDVYLIFAEDLYVYFIISDLAQSYYGWNNKPLYYYCYGRGVTQTDNTYTIEKFEKNCQHAKTIEVLKNYCSVFHANEKIYSDVIKRYYEEWIIRSIRILDNYIKYEDREQGELIINKYWGTAAVAFMRDKYKYVQSRKSMVSTVKYLICKLFTKGPVYTIKIIKS